MDSDDFQKIRDEHGFKSQAEKDEIARALAAEQEAEDAAERRQEEERTGKRQMRVFIGVIGFIAVIGLAILAVQSGGSKVYVCVGQSLGTMSFTDTDTGCGDGKELRGAEAVTWCDDNYPAGSSPPKELTEPSAKSERLSDGTYVPLQPRINPVGDGKVYDAEGYKRSLQECDNTRRDFAAEK